MSLVRLIQSNTIDSGLGVSIDENNIFYMGHSLGGIMGSCLAALEPDVKAYVLNAPGGGSVSQLLINSSIGAGALTSLQTIFGLAPANVSRRRVGVRERQPDAARLRRSHHQGRSLDQRPARGRAAQLDDGHRPSRRGRAEPGR
jgi:pimeloyl-ACP methyl ester carboxylesterase